MADSRFGKWFNKNRVPVVVIAVILLLAALVGLTVTFLQSSIDETLDVEENEEKVAEAISEVINFYREFRPELDSWWEIVALQGAGVDLNNENWTLQAWDPQDIKPNGPPTLHAGAIMGLIALGEVPATAWPERNLVQELLDMQDNDGSFGSGINNTIWGIVALDCAGSSEFTDARREKSIDYLLSQQKEDGGFAYSGEEGDPDMTAMALHAFAASKNIRGANEGIKKALLFLKEERRESGGFASFGQENANSVAVVISGLIAVGEDPLGAEWRQTEASENDGENLLDTLLAHQVDEGSFSFLSENPVSDPMATAQALMALGDLTAGETIFIRLAKVSAEQPYIEEEGDVINEETGDNESDTETDELNERASNEDNGIKPENDKPEEEKETSVRPSPDPNAQIPVPDRDNSDDKNNEEETVTPPENNTDKEDRMEVNVKVIGRNGNYHDGRVSVDKSGTSALKVLDATGISYKTGYGGMYVSEVAGEKENLDTGAGWKFKVNGTVPGTSAANYTLKENDAVIWWYAESPTCTGP